MIEWKNKSRLTWGGTGPGFLEGQTLCFSVVWFLAQAVFSNGYLDSNGTQLKRALVNGEGLFLFFKNWDGLVFQVTLDLFSH
jgi:hypothetical protein